MFQPSNKRKNGYSHLVSFYKDLENLPERRQKKPRLLSMDAFTLSPCKRKQEKKNISVGNSLFEEFNSENNQDISKDVFTGIIGVLVDSLNLREVDEHHTKKRSRIKIPQTLKGLKYQWYPKGFNMMSGRRGIPDSSIQSSVSQNIDIVKTKVFNHNSPNISIKIAQNLFYPKKHLVFLEFPPFTIYIGCYKSFSDTFHDCAYVLSRALLEREKLLKLSKISKKVNSFPLTTSSKKKISLKTIKVFSHGEWSVTWNKYQKTFKLKHHELDSAVLAVKDLDEAFEIILTNIDQYPIDKDHPVFQIIKWPLLWTERPALAHEICPKVEDEHENVGLFGETISV